MKAAPTLLLSACILLGAVSAAPTEEQGFVVSASRKRADHQTKHLLSQRRRRATQPAGNLSTAIDSDLYWYGNFTVGDSTDLELLIDTGSSDLLVNNGLYKASKYKTEYNGEANINFTISYEGVDRQGFGFETINGTLQNDLVSGAGYTVRNQTIGNTTTFAYYDVPPLPYANPGSGIIGFCFQGGSAFVPQAIPWVYNLYSQGITKLSRFGLAFGTSGVGQLVIGKLADALFWDYLVSVPQVGGNGTYAVVGDVTLNNTIVLKNQTIIMDVGTDNIQAPIEQSKYLFKLLGYQTQLLTEAPTPFAPNLTITVLNGFFNCNNPPTLGFSFPTESELKPGQNATVYNVAKDLWQVFDNGDNNCTSILGGTNGITVNDTIDSWLLGQPFFAGHYIDFNTKNDGTGTIGFADLRNPTDGSY